MTDQPESPEARRLRIARGFTAALPHARALSIALDDLGEGWVAMSMPWDARLVGDPVTGVIHGGPVSVLLDTCSGAAVLAHGAAPVGTATLDLRVDYMRPAVPGQRLRARAECYHMTRSVAFVRATATDDDAARPVATVAAAFTVEWAR
jgi:uncharacterized protein (TIGR00369 family)